MHPALLLHYVRVQCFPISAPRTGTSFVLAASGANIGKLSKVTGGWQHPRCQQGPSSAGSLAGGQQAAASIQPGNKYRTFVTLGPNGHTDTLCKAEVLHLGSCSAACALCAPPPCQCLGREPRAGLSQRPQLRQPSAKTSDHSLGLIPAAAELLCAQTSAEADGASAVAWCCPLDRAPQGPPVAGIEGSSAPRQPGQDARGLAD